MSEQAQGGGVRKETGRTFKPAMNSRRIGTFHAMIIARNMTHAAMTVLVSATLALVHAGGELTKCIRCDVLPCDEVVEGGEGGIG